MRKKILFCSLLLVCSFAGNAQSLADKIAAAYGRFESDPQLKYGLSSLTVLNAETGEVIFAKNEGTGMAPASTLKTVTSVTAFNLLGKDFTWETTLGYSGSVNNGVLTGDLILTGSGDPALGSRRYDQADPGLLLNRWLAAVKQAGIKKIQGRVVADDRLFGTQSLPQGWVWQDIGNYYGAGPTALNWRENEFGLYFKPGAAPGEPAELLRTEPEMDYLKIVNEAKTGRPGSGDNIYAFSAPYTDLVYVRGSYGIDLKKTIMASMPDPAYELALELKAKLTNSGLIISGPATTARRTSVEKQGFLPASVILDRYRSPELSKVIYWLNQKSINLYAENILKTMAVKQGKEGTFRDGVELVQDYWEKRLGADPNSIDILDGSGLSPENRITTLTMARILQSAYREPWYGSFYESLPLYNNMKMKSGSIMKVLSYTGYQKSSVGTPLVFSFITNHYNGSSPAIRQKMFKMLDAMK